MRADYDITVGERVRDGLGHWYEVVEVLGPRLYRAQMLTPVGTGLQPFGRIVRMGRSEMRKDGE